MVPRGVPGIPGHEVDLLPASLLQSDFGFRLGRDGLQRPLNHAQQPLDLRREIAVAHDTNRRCP